MGVLYIVWDQARWSGSHSGTRMSAYTTLWVKGYVDNAWGGWVSIGGSMPD